MTTSGGAPATDRARKAERASLFLLPAILVGVSALALGAGALFPDLGIGAGRAGRIGLAAVFVFTALGHFARARAMAEMLPPWVPARLPIIWATGLVEAGFAAALVRAGDTRVAGLAVIAFLLLVFPANVSAATRRVNFGGHGRGPAYILPRAALQLFLIAWAYWFAVR